MPTVPNTSNFKYIFSLDGQDYNDYNVTNGTANSIYGKIIVNEFRLKYVFSLDGQDYDYYIVDTKNATNGTANSI